jgi:hypothetical protein
VSTWHCLNTGCDESGEGDKAAEKHTKTTKHGTSTRTVGSIRLRDATGRVSNRKPGRVEV